MTLRGGLLIADMWMHSIENRYIPSDFLKGELSDEEIQAVAGRAIMIR